MELVNRNDERFWSKISLPHDNGCWLWLGTCNTKGYGQFLVGKDHQPKVMPAHRYSYEALRGGIPEGLTIDHLCRVKPCVNPFHMEAVTNKENILRGGNQAALNAKKTHCPADHELSEDNVRLIYTKFGISRRCRVCEREACRRYRARKKGYGG